MEEWIRIVLPMAPMAGTFVAIAALWWKLTSSVATKNDISSLKSDLKADMARLETGLKGDMAGLESGLKEDMAGLETSLKED
ncbi:MAG: hypothetical protein OXT74_19480, partial [Candidatus Poribacteria bacterium]|nr:hypothetical protein [Candidatus Poribacteria bacterium]